MYNNYCLIVLEARQGQQTLQGSYCYLSKYRRLPVHIKETSTISRFVKICEDLILNFK